MKIKFHHIIIALLLTATGCKKDNYDAPSVTLKGHLTYKGENINVEAATRCLLMFISPDLVNRVPSGFF
jgi:hypothetical protein